jgi:hypothetical protein
MSLDLIDLKTAADRLDIARRGKFSDLMVTISRLSRTRAAGCAIDPIENRRVLSAIDAATRETSKAATGPKRRLGLGALTGLRPTLFSDAPPFLSEVTP